MKTVLAALLVAVPSAAQGRIWIVDSAGGGHFRDLPAAVAAAAPGDILVARPGTYAGFTATKPLTVIGIGTSPSQVRLRASTGTDVVTLRLADQDRFALARLRIEFGPGQSGVRTTTAGTTLFIDNCEIAGAANFDLIERAGIAVTAPRLLSLTGTRASGRPALMISGGSALHSTVSVCGSLLVGGDGFQTGKATGWPPSPAVLAYQVWIMLSRTSVFGGGVSPSFQPWGTAPAMVANSCQLRIGGRPADVIQSLYPGSGPAQPAVQAPGAVVVRDPLVRLIPTLGAPEIAAASRIETRPVLNICVFAGIVSGALLIQGSGRAGDPFIIAIDRARLPSTTLLGPLAIDPAAAVISTVFVHPPGEITGLSIRIPPVPELLAAQVAVQAIGWSSATAGLELSNPAFAVVH